MTTQDAGNPTLDRIDRLAQNLESQIISIREGDTLTLVVHDRDFHLLLAACLENGEILRVMQNQQERVFRVTS